MAHRLLITLKAFDRGKVLCTFLVAVLCTISTPCSAQFVQPPLLQNANWYRNGAKIDLDFEHDRYYFNGTSYSGIANFITGASATFTRSGTTATYFDSSGNLQSSSTANTPRIDYDPATNTIRGLLMEDAATNLVTNKDFSTWTATNVNYSVSSTSNGAFNNQTSYVLTDNDAATAGGYTSASSTVSASTVYVGSVFVKKNSGLSALTTVRIVMVLGPVTRTVGVDIAPNGGSVTGVNSPTNTLVVDYGNYFRVAFSTTTGASETTAALAVYPRGSSPPATGSVEVFGPQIEANLLSSYIFTSGSTATRNTEAFTIPSVGGATTGTLGVVGILPFASANSQAIAGLDDGTSSNAMFCLVNGSQKKKCNTYASSNIYSDGPSAAYTHSASKMRMVLAVDQTPYENTAIDGTLYTSGSNATPTIANLTRMVVGAARGTNSKMNGWVNRVWFFQSKQSDIAITDFSRSY